MNARSSIHLYDNELKDLMAAVTRGSIFYIFDTPSIFGIPFLICIWLIFVSEEFSLHPLILAFVSWHFRREPLNCNYQKPIILICKVACIQVCCRDRWTKTSKRLAWFSLLSFTLEQYLYALSSNFSKISFSWCLFYFAASRVHFPERSKNKYPGDPNDRRPQPSQ